MRGDIRCTRFSDNVEIVSYMKIYADQDHARLAHLVVRFMSAVHRYDAGRTLPLMHEEKLTTPQIAVLEFVRMPRTISAIAEHVGLSRPATSQMINKLVQRRLVRRSEGILDRREKAVELSGSGITLLQKIGRFRSTRFAAALAVLAPATAEGLGSALDSVIAELEEPSEKATHPRSTKLMEGQRP